VGEEYADGGLALMIIGALTVIVVFLVSPILDPESPRGVRRKKEIQGKALRRAYRKKAPQLICHIFENYIRYYPKAFRDAPERLPASVEACWEENGVITILYNSKEFAFRFTEIHKNQEDLAPRQASLELYKNGRMRLRMTIEETVDKHYLAHWQPHEVQYLDYGYGTWIADLRNFLKSARKAAWRRGQRPS